jgi:hypothetical protein
LSIWYGGWYGVMVRLVLSVKRHRASLGITGRITQPEGQLSIKVDQLTLRLRRCWWHGND